MSKNKYKNNVGNKSVKGGTLVPFHKEGNTTYFKVFANDPLKTDSVLVGPNNKNGIALDNNEIVKETKNHIEVASDDLGTVNVIESLNNRMPLPDAFRQGFIRQELYKNTNNISNINKMQTGGFKNKNISTYEDRPIKKESNIKESNNLIYKIKKGDSLISIAKKFGLNSIDELVKLNNIKNPNLIIAGKDLILPDYVNAESSIQSAVKTDKMPNYDNISYNELSDNVKNKIDAYTQAFKDNKIKFNDIPKLYKQQVYNNYIRQGINNTAPYVAKNVLMSPLTTFDTTIRAGLNESRKLLNKSNNNNDYNINDYFGNFSFLGKDFEQKYPIIDAILNTAITPAIMGVGENIAARSIDNTLNKSLKIVNSNIKNNAKTVANLAGVEEIKIAPVVTRTNIRNGSVYNVGNKGIGKTGNVYRGQTSGYRNIQSNKGTYNYSASYSPKIKTNNAKITNTTDPFVGTEYYIGTNIPIKEKEKIHYVIQEPQKTNYNIKETIPANPWIYGKETNNKVPYKIGTEVPIYYEMNAPEGNTIIEQPILKESINKKTGNVKRKAEINKGKVTGTPIEVYSGYGYTYGNEGGPLIYLPRQSSLFTGGRIRMVNGGERTTITKNIDRSVSRYEDRPVKKNNSDVEYFSSIEPAVVTAERVEKAKNDVTRRTTKLRKIDTKSLTSDYAPTDIAPSKEVEDITLDNTLANRVNDQTLGGFEYLTPIDVLNPIKRQVQSPVKKGVYSIGKSGPSFVDKLRLGWDKFKTSLTPARAALLGSTAADVAGNIINAGIERNAIDATRYIDAPIQHQASKLLTNYNINPQLDSITNSAANAQRTINNNTLSSKVAQNRLNMLGLNTALNNSQLYANKENTETQLINQDTMNQQSIRNSNIDSYNQWLAGKTEFNNNKILSKANATASAINGIGQTLGNLATGLLQEQQFNNNVELLKALNPDASKVVPAKCGGRYNKKRRK